MEKNKKRKIYVQNDFIDDIVENPENYDFNQIMFISKYTPNFNTLYDYVVVNFPFIEDANTFRDITIIYGTYDEYLNSIINCDDDILKISFCMYIEPTVFNDIYSGIDEVIDKIEKEDVGYEYKICLLVALAIYNPDDETIDKIKKCIIKVVKNDEYLKCQFNDEELDNIIKQYISEIDNGVCKSIKKLSNKM